MPKPSPMVHPSFQAFYTTEQPRLVGWLQRNRVSDPEGVAQQAFAQVFESAGDRPETWTRPYVFRVVRGILKALGEKVEGCVLLSLDAELLSLDGDGESRATQIAAPKAHDHGPKVDARIERLKRELRRMPPRMRLAFAIPSIYRRSNGETARILARSVTRIDHLRSEAMELIRATFGGGAAGTQLVATLLRPEPDPEAIETPIRMRPAPALGDDGEIDACLAKPAQLDDPPPCFAVVHVAGRPDGDGTPLASEPCAVEWRVDEAGHWLLRILPRFEKDPGAGAKLIGLWLFEGDWLSGA